MADGCAERLQEIERDLRADARSAGEAADAIECDSGKDKGYGVKVGEARAFTIAADRIAGEISEILYA